MARATATRSAPEVAGLMYHEVSDDPTTSGFQRPGALPYTMTTAAFRRHLDAIAGGPLNRPVPMPEYNFDGIPGPTHNYSGLATGNVASAHNAGLVANPREAAQNLAHCRAARPRGRCGGWIG